MSITSTIQSIENALKQPINNAEEARRRAQHYIDIGVDAYGRTIEYPDAYMSAAISRASNNNEDCQHYFQRRAKYEETLDYLYYGNYGL